MGVYTRFKRDPNGFRALVELLESTPMVRRKKMIEVGMAEDPDFTEKALKYVFTFEDILKLPEMELADLMAKAPPRTISYAIKELGPEVRERFLKCCKPPVMAEVKDLFEAKIGPREIGGAQLKMIEYARQLEKVGYIKTKRIPLE